MKKKVCSKSKESYYVNLSTNEVYKYDKTSVKKGNFGSVLGKWDDSSKSVIYNEAESEDEVESLGEISEYESEYE
jgi:ribosomal protein L30E